VSRSVVAIVVGFTRRERLLQRSLEPLCSLRRKGVIGRLLYVTWDRPDLTPYVSPACQMPEVEVVRVPEPMVSGDNYQKKHYYQTYNIRAALSLVQDENALILKMRPDQIVDEAFLAAKILAFDFNCAPSPRGGFCMPPSPFQMKVWVPWADANQPFFMEDGLFMALRSDAWKLVGPASDGIVRDYFDRGSLWITNVARYIGPFLDDYPVFRRYLREFRFYAQHNECRRAQLEAVLFNPFFWTLMIANAWILADSFHIDCGYQGQILFYPPEDKNAGKGSGLDEPFEAVVSRPPFNSVETWRGGQHPGEFVANVSRLYGRLMDDRWQRSLFTSPNKDVSVANIHNALNAIRAYDSGVLQEMEDGYYAAIEAVNRCFFPEAAAVAQTGRKLSAV
jgi:hypothetical protein